MADHELIRETMVSLGEGMQDCGYDAVLETVEGNGLVGRAVRNPRDGDQLRVIILYLKDLAKTIKAESPSQERAQAMKLLEEAWELIRAAVYEEEDEAMVKTKKENSPLPVPRRPEPRMPVNQMMVAPVPAPKQKPQRAQPQQRPIQGSAGNHYFRSR